MKKWNLGHTYREMNTYTDKKAERRGTYQHTDREIGAKTDVLTDNRMDSGQADRSAG
jgi:hypothetical protein